MGFVYLDTDDEATRPFKVALGYAGRPTFVLVDGVGNIVKHWVGIVAEESFFNALDEILANY